ncbi:Enhancer of polycomb protein [Babesia duncani]|uniref:Enhancer of polycomb protein n=1 Tax=Babesia duncani TaxID=323732 RepID=A0AAD9PIU0_9APIC|nr:Enhancer of polycomb protein [Babesia duncani]
MCASCTTVQGMAILGVMNRSMIGIKLSETLGAHYNLFKADFEFVKVLNERLAGGGISLVDFVRLMDIFEKAAVHCHRDQLFTSDLAQLVARENGIRVPLYALREVHGYWSRRRREHGIPLLRPLWPPTDPTDASPLAVFRPRSKDKMFLRRPKRGRIENIQRLYCIVSGFKRVLKLLSKIRQRDEKKLTIAQLEIILFDQSTKERVDPTYVCPLWRSIIEVIGAQRRRPPPNESKSGLGFESLRGTGHLYMGAGGDNMPGDKSYTCTRASRRFGRGGRVWIDRRLLYHQSDTNGPVVEHTTDSSPLRQVCDYWRYNINDIYSYENPIGMGYNPGIACAYEATHLLNTGDNPHPPSPHTYTRTE